MPSWIFLFMKISILWQISIVPIWVIVNRQVISLLTDKDQGSATVRTKTHSASFDFAVIQSSQNITF